MATQNKVEINNSNSALSNVSHRKEDIALLLSKLDELQSVQKQLQYFTREVKLWATPQRKL